MILIEDMGNKVGLHAIKNNYWKSQGIEVQRYPLPTGDYVLMNDKIQDVLDRKRKRNLEVKKMDFLGCYNIGVDSKADISELYQNMVQSHERFRDELLLAQNNNIKLYILTENKNNVRKIEDLVFWDNPRKYIWMAEVRKVFTDLQKKWYSDENAIKFLVNRNIDILSNDLYKRYFKELKEIPLDDILAYLKNKKVVAYLKENKIKVRKKPMDNNSLIKSMQEMELKYGVTFLFCSPEESGERVIKLLTQNL